MRYMCIVIGVRWQRSKSREVASSLQGVSVEQSKKYMYAATNMASLLLQYPLVAGIRREGYEDKDRVLCIETLLFEALQMCLFVQLRPLRIIKCSGREVSLSV